MGTTIRWRAPWVPAVILAAAAGCAEGPPPAEPVRPVRVLQVYATGGSRTRTFSGTTQAGAESNLSFKVAGTLEKIEVKVGEAVGAGKLLASMDSRDFELQVQDAEAALAQAQARARRASANLDRVRGLYESNNASQADYDAALADSQSADAQVESATKRLELAKSQLGYARLLSPVAGTVAEVRAEEGENVSAGQPVLVLTSGSRLEVKVAVPEAFIAGVREGQKVDVRFDALPDLAVAAVVTEVAVTPAGTATTFPVTVRLAEAAPGARPGLAAEVAFRFESADGRERMIVPPVAIGEDRAGRFAYVVEPQGEGEGVVHRREVRVGELTADGIEVLSGLEEGDLLVTAGVSRIEEGLRVKLPGAGAAGS